MIAVNVIINKHEMITSSNQVCIGYQELRPLPIDYAKHQDHYKDCVFVSLSAMSTKTDDEILLNPDIKVLSICLFGI